jgi:hypothetical protein
MLPCPCPTASVEGSGKAVSGPSGPRLCRICWWPLSCPGGSARRSCSGWRPRQPATSARRKLLCASRAVSPASKTSLPFLLAVFRCPAPFVRDGGHAQLQSPSTCPCLLQFLKPKFLRDLS